MMGRTVAMISGDFSPTSSAESSFRDLDDVFLQNQTRIWLGEVLHTRLDDQLNISDLLADGELLFEVSKIVWTMLLAKCKELRDVKGHKYNLIGSRKSSGRYRPYANIDSFLKICKILGVNGIDLFSSSDVVEKRDTRKVCMCIRSLSKKARSKQLKVPDFNSVTYTVAMPTNMVGCLRRSLELSKSSCTSSANYTPYRDSKLKFRQKNPVAACDRNYDSNSEASDDTESNYMGVPSYSSSTNYSYDTSSLKDSYLENSPGVSSMVKKYTLALSASQGDIQDQERDEYEQGHKSACLVEPPRSLCSQYVKSYNQADSISPPSVDSQMIFCARPSHINNGGKHSHEMGGLDISDVDSGIGNDASTGDSLDDNMVERLYISHQLTFPDLMVLGTDNNPDLFDREDNMLNFLLGADSPTGRTLQNGCGRRFSDDFEDVEVSSVTSMSSVLGRVLNLDFDDQSDEDDFKWQVSEVENSLNRSSSRGYQIQDMAEHENSVHSSISGTERSHLETELGNHGFSTKLFLPCPNSEQSHTMEYQEQVGSSNNEIGISPINSKESACLKDSKFTVPDNAKVVNGTATVELDPVIRAHQCNCLPVSCSSNILDEIYEDSNSSGDVVIVEGSECHRLSITDDDCGLKHQDKRIVDINSQGTRTSYMVAVHNTAVDYNFVSPANKCQTTAEKYPCSTRSSANLGKQGHQACTDCNEDLYFAECMNKDESKQEIVDNPEMLLDGRESTDARLSPDKPHRRPLLRTVVKGTALCGMLFLLLHLRSQSGREKEGEVSKRSNQFKKGMECTSKKDQGGGMGNGIYPAAKLKFEN